VNRSWLVTGSSTGLGRALVEAIAAAGECVLATARKPEILDDLAMAYPETVVTTGLDVRDELQCAAAVDLAVERFGGIDVLVNNAAYGLFGTVEEVADDELRAMLETNLLGPWRLTRKALPVMRAQGSGHVLLVSSTSGYLALPGIAAYTTGKFALEGMGESLAMEVAPFGIRVTVLQPGGYATEWGNSLVEARGRMPEYEAFTSEMLAGMRALKGLPTVHPPAEFADAVLRLVDMNEPPLRLPLTPFGWQTAVDAARGRHAGLLAAAAATGASIPAGPVEVSVPLN